MFKTQTNKVYKRYAVTGKLCDATVILSNR